MGLATNRNAPKDSCETLSPTSRCQNLRNRVLANHPAQLKFTFHFLLISIEILMLSKLASGRVPFSLSVVAWPTQVFRKSESDTEKERVVFYWTNWERC